MSTAAWIGLAVGGLAVFAALYVLGLFVGSCMVRWDERRDETRCGGEKGEADENARDRPGRSALGV